MSVVEHLYADQFGSFIGKYSERLKITQGKQVLQQAPLLHLRSVTVANSGIGISSDAIAACCERGIPIVLLDGSGSVYASIYSSGLVGTVQTRREQLLAFFDERRARLALAFSGAKVLNQAATLLYWARNRREAHPDDAHWLTQAASDVRAWADQMLTLPWDDGLFERLMGCEGQAAHLYWQSARLLVPADYGFGGRSGRGATDPVNSLLNYGYGILYAEIERAIILSGLDPYGGFLHADRPGKPSLVLDLIEEFRQIVVDRPVFGLVARGYTVAQRGLTLHDQPAVVEAVDTATATYADLLANAAPARQLTLRFASPTLFKLTHPQDKSGGIPPRMVWSNALSERWRRNASITVSTMILRMLSARSSTGWKWSICGSAFIRRSII